MRCNTGVNPLYLADQHLIAEQVELLMISGLLTRINNIPKSPIPPKMKLGTGHMLFWTNKLIYLQRRLDAVKLEVARRGFKVTDRCIELNNHPIAFHNDWAPDINATNIIRGRITEKMDLKYDGFWRFKSNKILKINYDAFRNDILNSPLYFV